MRNYYTAETIRAAEAPLLASQPEGTLMRRAAYGLAGVVAAELRRRTGGVAGRDICAVVGSGDNGGDALWAATFLRRRGARAAAVLLAPDHTHRRALAAFRKAGGLICESVPATTDLVLDGVVDKRRMVMTGQGRFYSVSARVTPKTTTRILNLLHRVFPEGGAPTAFPVEKALLTKLIGGSPV